MYTISLHVSYGYELYISCEIFLIPRGMCQDTVDLGNLLKAVEFIGPGWHGYLYIPVHFEKRIYNHNKSHNEVKGLTILQPKVLVRRH